MRHGEYASCHIWDLALMNGGRRHTYISPTQTFAEHIWLPFIYVSLRVIRLTTLVCSVGLF